MKNKWGFLDSIDSSEIIFEDLMLSTQNYPYPPRYLENKESRSFALYLNKIINDYKTNKKVIVSENNIDVPWNQEKRKIKLLNNNDKILIDEYPSNIFIALLCRIKTDINDDNFKGSIYNKIPRIVAHLLGINSAFGNDSFINKTDKIFRIIEENEDFILDFFKNKNKNDCLLIEGLMPYFFRSDNIIKNIHTNKILKEWIRTIDTNNGKTILANIARSGAKIDKKLEALRYIKSIVGGEKIKKWFENNPELIKTLESGFFRTWIEMGKEINISNSYLFGDDFVSACLNNPLEYNKWIKYTKLMEESKKEELERNMIQSFYFYFNIRRTQYQTTKDPKITWGIFQEYGFIPKSLTFSYVQSIFKENKHNLNVGISTSYKDLREYASLMDPDDANENPFELLDKLSNSLRLEAKIKNETSKTVEIDNKKTSVKPRKM